MIRLPLAVQRTTSTSRIALARNTRWWLSNTYPGGRGGNHTKKRFQSTSSSAEPKIPLGIRIRHALSFSFHTGLVLGGVGLTGLVVYYFVHDILLPTSDVQVFTKARHLIEKDAECQKVLGGGKLKAYGEHTSNKWTRNRPIASRRGFDGAGREHLLMQFHVKGNADVEGLVRLEMVKSEEKKGGIIGQFDFRYLALEVPNHPRIYVIDNTPKIAKPTARSLSNGTGFLGVKWGKSKD